MVSASQYNPRHSFPEEYWLIADQVRRTGIITDNQFKALVGSRKNTGILNGPDLEKFREEFKFIHDNTSVFTQMLIKQSEQKNSTVALESLQLGDLREPLDVTIEDVNKPQPYFSRPIEAVNDFTPLEMELAAIDPLSGYPQNEKSYDSFLKD